MNCRLDVFLLALALSAFAPPTRAADVAASQLIGARLQLSNGQSLGAASDLLCDVAHRRITYLVVSRTGAAFAIPWRSLALVGKQRLAVETTLTSKRQSISGVLNSDPTEVAVEHSLVGRPVVAADGTRVGHITDLVFDTRSGAVASLRIAMGAPGAPSKVLPWNAIADFFAERAIVTKLSPQQFATLAVASQHAPSS